VTVLLIIAQYHGHVDFVITSSASSGAPRPMASCCQSGGAVSPACNLNLTSTPFTSAESAAGAHR